MANIFDLNEQWQKITTGAGTVDGQTIADIVEKQGENTPEKIADMVAVVERIMGEITTTKEYRKKINDQLDRMENNAEQMRVYILDAVEEIGTPKPEAPEFKIVEIEGKPWIKSAWTEFKAPRIEILDERIVDSEYKQQKPPEIDLQLIAKDWTEKADAYRMARRQLIIELKDKVEAKEITEAEAKQALYEHTRTAQPQISGITVKQPKGVNYQ